MRLTTFLIVSAVCLLTSQFTVSAEDKPASQAPTVPSEGDRKKEAEEIKRLQDLYLRNISVFIRRGEVIQELNSFYSTDRRTDFLQISPTNATLISTTRRFFDVTTFTRIGLATGLELDVIVPAFVYAEQEIDSGTTTTKTVSRGLGDVSAALRYQLLYERGIRPSVIVDVMGRFPTGGQTLRGTDSYFAGGGISLLKTLDPVVFFGRIGYMETFPRHGRNLGNIIEYSFGMGFSLNDRVSFNMQVTNSLIGRTTLLGQSVRGSGLEIANLLFITTVLITKKLFIEPVVGIGLTDDAFDATLGLRIPYRF